MIAGDGVGIEVVEAGLGVLRAAAERHGFTLATDELPWGSVHYRETGAMMPADGIETLRGYDAIYVGAVGSPDVPDDVTLWGLLLPIRQVLDQYVNLRPVRLLARGREPAPHGEDRHAVRTREHRGRVLRGRRAGAPGPAARGGDPDGRVHARGRRANRALRVRARSQAARQSSRASRSRTPAGTRSCSGTTWSPTWPATTPMSSSSASWSTPRPPTSSRARSRSTSWSARTCSWTC